MIKSFKHLCSLVSSLSILGDFILFGCQKMIHLQMYIMDLFFIFGGTSLSCLCTWWQLVYFCTQEAFSAHLNGCFSGHNNRLLTFCLSCSLKPHQFNFLRSCSKVRKTQNSTLLLFIIQTKKEIYDFSFGNCILNSPLLGVPSNFFKLLLCFKCMYQPFNK